MIARARRDVLIAAALGALAWLVLSSAAGAQGAPVACAPAPQGEEM